MRSLYNFFDSFTRMRCTATYGMIIVGVVLTAAEWRKILDCMPLRHAQDIFRGRAHGRRNMLAGNAIVYDT